MAFGDVEMNKATDENTPLKEMIKDPSDHFNSPSDVLSHESLAVEDKIAILKSWRVDEEEKSTATAENMGGSDNNRLSEVITALQTLQDS